MALSKESSAFVEVGMEKDAVEAPAERVAFFETKSRLGPMACYVGSPLVLVMMGLVFLGSQSLSQIEGTNHRILSESEAAGALPKASAGCCRFAKAFEDVDWYDPQTRSDFLANVMHVERRFLAKPAMSFDADTGMTYDGIGLDYETGEAQQGTLRTFSAPSKEALHLSLLALALEDPAESEPSERAAAPLPRLYSADEALDILEKKARKRRSRASP